MAASPVAVTAPAAAPSRTFMTAAAVLILVVPTMYALMLWLDLREAWLHPELYGSSEYIWGVPTEMWYQRLGKMLDWKAFDPNVNRVRPISDAADTIDTVARPYLTAIIGPHPSITPIAIVSAILSPLCLFFFFRRAGFDPIRSAALTALFISSIAFLSLHIGYIRPAKKATLVAFCLAMYLAQRHAQTRGTGVFIATCLTVFFAFFADELALGLFPIVGVIFFPSLLKDAPWWKRAAFLSLPLGFLVMTAWGLPAIYARYSIHGAWSAMADTKKFTLFAYLIDPELYRVSLSHVARAMMTTLGIRTHVPVTEIATLLVLLGVTLAVLARRSAEGALAQARFGVVASAISIVGLGFYVTLLDFYPDITHLWERSYLGSFMYYYHSPMVIPIILWLAYVWQFLSEMVRDQLRAQRAVLAGGLVICAVAVVGNFALFHNVNQLVQLIHLFPYSTDGLFRELRAHHDELRASQANPGAPVIIRFDKTRNPLIQTYNENLKAVFGARWQDNDYYRVFEDFKVTPIMQDHHLTHLVRAFYPGSVFEVRIQ
ncbi:MAG: hypothetical protein AB7K36_12505 [Chloroflexota bacterium]